MDTIPLFIVEDLNYLSIIVSFVSVVLLLMLSAFVSASEAAFFSLSPQHISDMQESEDSVGQKVLKLREDPEYLLATILITNNLVNVAIVVISTFFIESIFDFSGTPIWGFVIQTVVITFLLLLFGEIMPKLYATQNPQKMAQRASTFMGVLQHIFRPISRVLVSSTKVVNKRMAKRQSNNLSIDELSQALELATDQIEEEKEILKGIVSFGNINAMSVMTSRTDMLALSVKLPFNEVIKKVEEYGYSRIPIYNSGVDQIRGILYIKDLIPHLNKGAQFKWQTLIRPAYFVPETKMLDDLLQEFQKNKTHMAIVVDEYGGTSGVITMEDILEEVVGEISDEYDDEEKLYQKIDNFTYIFEAKILLTDFFKATGIEESEFEHNIDEVETLAGLVLEIRGVIPAKGDRIDYKRFVFEIVAADNRRIHKIKLLIKEIKHRDA